MFSKEGQYPVSAYYLEDTLTCGFSRRQFEQLVLQHPQVGLQDYKPERTNHLADVDRRKFGRNQY
jgi:CRP-like cAMP-binding protein